MLTERFQNNLTKLMEITNTSNDTNTCKVIVISDNNKAWKKSILDAIFVDHSLFKSKHYNITCENFENEKHDKYDFNGCINVQIKNILDAMNNFECMLITINGLCYCYNREKGMPEKSKFVYIIVKN